MDVANLVKSITNTFEEAANLVNRIRKQKAEASDVDLEPIDDLIDSLMLGPTIVRGHYEPDAKRYGSIFMTGDPAAREQLKDALINLQMTVLSALRTVILDEKDPDYDAIQAASDDCRVNVGVSLGQLSQRVSKFAKGMNNSGKMHSYDNMPPRPVQRSMSHSTTSSGHTSHHPMTPPESDPEFLPDVRRVNSQRRQQFTARAPDLDVMDVMHVTSYSGLYAPSNGHGFLSHNQSDRIAESPVSPQEAGHLGHSRTRDSLASANSSTRHPSMYQSEPYQEGQGGKDHYSDNISIGYAGYHSNDSAKSSSYNELTSATLGKSPTSPNLIPVQRKPVSILQESLAQSPNTIPQFHRSSIPEDKVYVPPSNQPGYQTGTDSYQPLAPFPSRAPSQQYDPYFQPSPMVRADTFARLTADPSTLSQGINGLNLGPTSPYMSNASMVQPTLSRSDTMNQASVGPLNLPTEKNLLGYCKGAFRLQIGLEKKAFGVANRPLGYSSMIQYWKCTKCNFEGPCSTDIPPGAKKPEKAFDPVIRTQAGIRYKWVFLAKCHVPLKSIPEGKRDGSYGSFCCIFCTAEGVQRGWIGGAGGLYGDQPNANIRNSVASTSSLGTTPVFGNLQGLMDHLQMHRQPEHWPGVEMQGRMKCVVGRIAPRGEDYDINFLPMTAIEM